MTDQPIEKLHTVAGVRFQRVGKLYHFDYAEYPNLQVGDYVVVETTRGRQMGEVVNFNAIDSNNQNNTYPAPRTGQFVARIEF